MMKFNNIYSLIIALMASAATLCSCNSVIYDDEGDCDPHYKVRFRYVKHLKSNNPNVDIDAFASEVNAVTLYLVDEATGKIVWSKSESGSVLNNTDYLMDVPVNPGRYHLVAWCGEGVGPHFYVPESDRPEGLSCSLMHDQFGSRAAGDTFTYSTAMKDLFHGRTMSQEFPEEEGTHIYNVDLTKDTNDITVLLQQTSDSPMRENQFSFYITDRNHELDWTNEVVAEEGELIKYTEHTKAVGSGSVAIPAEELQYAQFPAVFAELRTSRLMANKDAVLTVVNNETGAKVLEFPLTEYFTKYRPTRYNIYSDQEYLDRQDHYDLIFFLDAGYRWERTRIYINSWRVVFTNTDL